MADDPRTVARNKRLEELRTAVTQWATEERKNLNDEVALGKSILKSRTGSERLAQTSVQSASILTRDEINQFLTGD